MTKQLCRVMLPMFALLLTLGATSCGDDFAGAPPETYACVEPPMQGQPPHPRGAEYQAVLDEMVRGSMPGAMMMLRSSDGQVWRGASGKADMASGVAMQSCNLSRAGSIAKTFTAALVMTLVEEQGLDLDDRLSDHLSPHMMRDLPNGEAVTVRQILNQTSGIPDYVDAEVILAMYNGSLESLSRAQGVDRVRGREPLFAPGEDWSYSNTNYELAGFLIEALSGKSYEALLSERILLPLGLTQTSMRTDGSTPAGVVRGYVDHFADGRVYDSTDFGLGYGSTGGALVTTTQDLFVFIEALFAGQVVSPTSLETMQSWVKADVDDKGNDVLYGLGLMAGETIHGRAIGHNGGLLGYTSAMFHFPETSATAILLVNGAFGRTAETLAREIEERLPSLLHSD